MARVVREVEPDLAGSGISPLNLFSGFFMRTSARNALRGTVTGIASDALNAEIAVSISADTTIYALVTSESARELGLLCRPRGHRADQGAFRDDRAGPRAAGHVGAQLRAAASSAAAKFQPSMPRSSSTSAAANRWRPASPRTAPPRWISRRASRPARCSTPPTSSSPSIEPGGVP